MNLVLQLFGLCRGRDKIPDDCRTRRAGNQKSYWHRRQQFFRDPEHLSGAGEAEQQSLNAERLSERCQQTNSSRLTWRQTALQNHLLFKNNPIRKYWDWKQINPWHTFIHKRLPVPTFVKLQHTQQRILQCRQRFTCSVKSFITITIENGQFHINN